MTIRDLASAKLQQLSEPLLQEVSDSIDFIIHKHLAKTSDTQPDEKLFETWSKWFEEVDLLDVAAEPVSQYQQILPNKYR